jgi:hypothetical protein
MSSPTPSALIQEAERCFVCKKFRLASARSLQALTLLVTGSDSQEQFFSQKLIPHLEYLRQYRLDHALHHTSTKEQNCLAIIIQCFFELNQHEDAAKVLPSFYGSVENAPFNLQIIMIQMLTYLSKFDEAQVYINNLEKNVKADEKLVLQELSEHLHQKRTEGQKTIVDNKFLNNLAIEPNDRTASNEIMPEQRPSRRDEQVHSTLILPGYKSSGMLTYWKNSLTQRWNYVIGLIRSNPKRYTTVCAIIVGALFMCTVLIRLYKNNHDTITIIRNKTIQSVQDALKMALWIL